jgi:hypothetical protein
MIKKKNQWRVIGVLVRYTERTKDIKRREQKKKKRRENKTKK